MSTNLEGSYTLLKLEISSGNDTIDLRSMFVDFTLYESIWENFIVGAISVIDSFDLKTVMPIVGGEDIRISFHTSGMEDYPIEFVGKVYSVSSPTKINEHTNGYILRVCSSAMLDSARTFVYRSFKDTPSNIVKSIHSNFLQASMKPLESVPTKGIGLYNLGSFNASEAISVCLRNAVSTNDEYGYLFYETMKSFCCKPLQFLYRQAPVFEYYYKGANVYEDVSQREIEQFNAIQSFEDVAEQDFFSEIQEGNLGSSNLYFDLISKSCQNVKFDSKKFYDKGKSLGSQPLKKNGITNQKFNDLVSIEYSTSSDNSFNTKSLYAKYEANKIRKRINVFGDSSVYVGAVCNAWLPNLNSYGEGIDLVSGKFLIAEIKHTVSNNKYYQTILLQKDAYEELR